MGHDAQSSLCGIRMGQEGEIAFCLTTLFNLNYWYSMKKIINAIKKSLTPSEEAVRQAKFKKAAEGAKGYCYFSEDADGNPTVAIAGSNVFTIVSGETILDKREVSVEDAKKFVLMRETNTSHNISMTQFAKLWTIRI